MTLTTGILTGGSNNHQTTSEEANAHATDFISTGVTGPLTNTAGVAPATGSFAVNAQGSPDMTVAVSAGVAYVAGTPTSQNSQKIRVKNSATANVTIAANSSGSTKYNFIYISLDASKLANPAVGADDVATLVTSRSSNATTDDGTPPTYGCLLAVVTVANGASSLANGTVADKRVPAAYRSSPATSAVNQVDIASAATGTGPTISAVGTDTNIDLNVVTKGTGVIKFNGTKIGTISSSSNLGSRAQALTASGSGSVAYSTNNPTMVLTPGKYLLVATASARAVISSQDSTFNAVIYSDTGSAEVVSNGSSSTGTSATIYPTYSVHSIVTPTSNTTYSGRASQSFGTAAAYTFVNSTLIAIPLTA